MTMTATEHLQSRREMEAEVEPMPDDPQDRAAMLTLADRVEREAPNRELDRAVAQAINPGSEWRPYSPRGRIKWLYDSAGHPLIYGEERCLHYTTTIDGAASLMPDGWVVRVSQIRFGMWRVEAWRGDKSFKSPHDAESVAESEPQARTTAALRARAAEGGDGDG